MSEERQVARRYVVGNIDSVDPVVWDEHQMTLAPMSHSAANRVSRKSIDPKWGTIYELKEVPDGEKR